MSRLREKYDLKPLVIHVNYLVNLASTTELFLKKSIEAFRGEVERALALCAEYLVLHPGSFRGADREVDYCEPQRRLPRRLRDWISRKANLTILIENTAGAEYSLGGSFRAGRGGSRPPAGTSSHRGLYRHMPHPCRRI